MEFSYRLLRGREGVTGHIRGMGHEYRVSVRGLTPETDCALYALRDGQAALCCRQKADREGQAVLSAAQPGRLFLTADGRVVAWETGLGAEETYWQACQWLQNEAAKHQEKKTQQRATVQAGAAIERPTPAPADGPVPPPQDNQEPSEPWRDHVPQMAEQPAAEAPDPPYALRPAGTGEPVDALPALQWPAAARDLRGFFRGRMPFAPFRAPGWRFVRAPSAIPGVAYCALGYWARDARVRKTAWAVPGMPQRPPVPLPGYRYRPGNQGMGYWVIEWEAEK